MASVLEKDCSFWEGLTETQKCPPKKQVEIALQNASEWMPISHKGESRTTGISMKKTASQMVSLHQQFWI